MIRSLIFTLVLATASISTGQTTQPTIVELPKMELAGIATFGSPANGLFAKLWGYFPANVKGQPGMSTSPYCYGVSLDVPSHAKDKAFSYLVAGQVSDAEKVPAYLVRLPLPAGPYAVFMLRGGVPEGIPEIGPMLDYAYNTWLPDSNYESAAPLNIERYHVTKDKTTIEIMIPLKKLP